MISFGRIAHNAMLGTYRWRCFLHYQRIAILANPAPIDFRQAERRRVEDRSMIMSRQWQSRAPDGWELTYRTIERRIYDAATCDFLAADAIAPKAGRPVGADGFGFQP
jgi:hypothetical protein